MLKVIVKLLELSSTGQLDSIVDSEHLHTMITQHSKFFQVIMYNEDDKVSSCLQ